MAVFRRGKSDGPAEPVGDSASTDQGSNVERGALTSGPDSLAARRLQHGVNTVSRWTVSRLQQDQVSALTETSPEMNLSSPWGVSTNKAPSRSIPRAMP